MLHIIHRGVDQAYHNLLHQFACYALCGIIEVEHNRNTDSIHDVLFTTMKPGNIMSVLKNIASRKLSSDRKIADCFMVFATVMESTDQVPTVVAQFVDLKLLIRSLKPLTKSSNKCGLRTLYACKCLSLLIPWKQHIVNVIQQMSVEKVGSIPVETVLRYFESYRDDAEDGNLREHAENILNAVHDDLAVFVERK